MEIGYTPEQEAMRQELRAYYEKLLDPATVAELTAAHGIGEAPRRIWKQMCADGWAGIGWPKEYGGQGRSAIEQFIFFDESMRAGAPVPMLTLNTVGPTIMEFGTDEQKADFLPRILAGDIHFCIGYSEPGAGTDLASLQTRAVRDGDEYVINGQKMWTSLSERRRLLLARGAHRSRRREAQGHLDDHRADGHARHHAVAAPPARQATTSTRCSSTTSGAGGQRRRRRERRLEADHQPAQPRAGHAVLERRDRARTHRGHASGRRRPKLPDGRRVIDQEWVQLNLAKVHAKVEFLRLINWKVAWEATQGVLDIGHCSTLKVFGTEFYMEGYQLLMEILGPVSYLEPDAPGAVLRSRARAGHPRLDHPHLRRWGQRDATRPDLPVHAGLPEG